MVKARFKFGAYELLVVQVLRESYGTFNYLLCRDGQAVLVDAGEAGPLLETLKEEKVQLLNILITHHHPDHVGGCRALQDQLGVQSMSPGVESGEFSVLGTRCRSFATPGHLKICKSYAFPELGIVFTGDTLINGGCGRIFDGTAEQYFHSLQRIKELQDETLIFGGHDYLEANMEFALSVEPDHAGMRARLALYRSNPVSAIFVSLAEEKRTNPFLRVNTAEAFAELRRRKDRF